MPPPRSALALALSLALSIALALALAGSSGGNTPSPATCAVASAFVGLAREGVGFVMGMAVSPAGVVFMSNTAAHQVVLAAPPSYTVQAFAGARNERGNVLGVGTNARFDFPFGLVFGPGASPILYVIDGANAAIKAIAPGGAVTLVCGSGESGGGGSGGGGIQADGDCLETAIFSKRMYGLAFDLNRNI